MFGLMRNFYHWCKHRKERVVTVALLGVDNAGKSTILHRMKGEIQEFIAPTVGFSSEIIKQGVHSIKVFDLGGGANIRGIWPRYYAELHGAMFVIDSSDRERLHVVREVLYQVLDHDRFANKPLLIFANKQDKADPMTSADIASNLGLEKFKGLQYHIITCTALLLEDTSPPDPKIASGLRWLTSAIDGNYAVLQKRIAKESEEQKEEERIEREEKRKRVEARKRERELEREKEEKERVEMQQHTSKTDEDSKITVITESVSSRSTSSSRDDKSFVITPTPHQQHHHDDVSTDNNSARVRNVNTVTPLDLFDRGGDMLRSTDDFSSILKSKQKTPRNVYATPTTIVIKSGESLPHLTQIAPPLPPATTDQPESTSPRHAQLHNNDDESTTTTTTTTTTTMPPSPSPSTLKQNRSEKSLSNLPPLPPTNKQTKLETTTTTTPPLLQAFPLPPLEKAVYV